VEFGLHLPANPASIPAASGAWNFFLACFLIRKDDKEKTVLSLWIY
jgi:hypothetical protein